MKPVLEEIRKLHDSKKKEVEGGKNEEGSVDSLEGKQLLISIAR
jgi:hypothetical protein